MAASNIIPSLLLKDAVDFSEIKRVLVIKLRHHGDVLLSSPVFTALKAQYPHLEVDGLVYKDTQDMLSLHPAISQLHLIDRGWKKLGVRRQLEAEWGLISQLKQRQYDLVIHLTEHWRGMLLTRLLKPRLSVCQIYARRPGKLWKKTFTHHYPVNAKHRHTVEKHLDALRRIGLYPSDEERRLTAVAGDSAELAVLDRLAEQGASAGEYIHIHPTSRWLFKSWDVDKMASLINRLQEKGHTIVLSAAPSGDEMRMMEDILERLVHPVINFSGSLTLKELIALIQHAKLFIGVDSVPMHIASATQTPCVALFGPSNEREWSPWLNKHVILSSNHPCRPCDLAGCGDGWRSECLSQIQVEQALNAVERLTS
ncbi:putative lipopolysaccharide heptosyltransferase III [Hahella sp. HN01]|uniref:putative lipopolysaccharide heptosyltransferase III n=1 Tax=Hahella sp. HN01 TaxID=2847262 RepID=UPI001C1EBC4E|nr:putative lipopolysaccharide heptosyltransferase III [Hahella sp. HN01]MBU6953175.1 putative lipopolysaccharide heptosyltransferase III [Hahella sp. HN01]